MALPNVAQGDPHVAAHNNERQLLNKLQDLSDPEFAQGLSATIEAALAEDETVIAAAADAVALAGGGGSLIVQAGGTVNLDNAKPNGFLIGYRVTATATIEGALFAPGSYIFERDTSVGSGWTFRTIEMGEAVITGPDTEAPTAPDLTVDNSSQTQLVATFSGGTDDTAVTQYRTRIDGGAWTVGASPRTFTGLTASTSYTIDAQAGDAAGNWSASDTWTGSTAAPASYAPAAVGTLFFDYDASTGATLYASETNISQIADASGSARHLVAAASGTAPNQVTLNGKNAAQFTPANSDRLRYVGSYTLSAATGYTVCWIGRIDALAYAKILHGIGFSLSVTTDGLEASSSAALAQLHTGVNAGEAHLVTVAVTASAVTLRVAASGKNVGTGSTINMTNNLSIGANYSGGGSEFSAITHGRAWAYAEAISDADHAGLHAWAQTNWGVE